MAERIIKNDTDETIILKDLGSISIDAGETFDLGNSFHAHDLTVSDELLTRLGNGDLKLQNPDVPNTFYTTAQALRIINMTPIISPMDEEGRQFLRAESRPLSCTTCFTSTGDNPDGGVLNGDTRLEWDASIDTEGYWMTQETLPQEYQAFTSIPDGMKCHMCEISFNDSVWIKEGCVYYMNCMKGSYFSMGAKVPHMLVFMYKGQLYVNVTGSDLVVDKYINRHPIQGNVPMGDEMNTETCSQELPSYIKYCIAVFVPVEDTSSYGYMELEVYRQRTVDLDDFIGTGIVPYTP